MDIFLKINFNNVFMYLLFLVGIIVFIATFIKVKSKPSNNYTNKFSCIDIVDSLSTTKIVKALVNHETKDNKAMLIRLKTMQSKLTLEKLLVYKLFLGMIIVFLVFTIKISFTNVATIQMLHPNTIYESTEFRIDNAVAKSILTEIGNRYEDYFKNDDYNGLANEIKNINIDLGLGLDDEDVIILTDVYKSTYESTNLTNVEKLLFLLMSVLSSPLINLIINIRYKLIRSRMIKEFEKLEIITILLLNRDDLNILEILKEMHRHSKYLRPYLTKCLRLYTSNPKKALNTLIQDIEDAEFKSFIIVLSSCLDKSKEANQEVLKIQRKLRMMLEETSLNKKTRDKELYLTMAQFPLLMLLAINLILPVITGVNLDF